MPRVRILALDFLERHPADCARILENLPTHSVSPFIRSIRPEVAASVMEKMLINYGADCLQSLDIKEAASVISHMKTPPAARLIRAINPQLSEQILDMIPAYGRSQIQRALRYPEQTVGRLMDSNPFCLPETIPLSEAVRKVKSARSLNLNEIFIVDENHVLSGVLPVADLLSSERSLPLHRLMTPNVPFLSVRANLKSAAQYAGWQRYSTLPVVEQDHTLVGVLKSSTVMNSLGECSQETQSDDFLADMFSMTKMYWIVMAELMSTVAGEEEDDHESGGKNVKGN